MTVLIPGALLILLGIIGAQVAPQEQKVIFDNLHWTASYITAALLAWVGVRHTPGPNQVKRFFAIGLTAYAIGQVLWDIQVAEQQNPFPYYSDLFFVLLAPCYAWGVLQYLGRTKVEIRSAFLDIAGLSIAFLSLTLAIYIPRQHSQTPFQMAVLVAYPLGYFVATAAVLVAVLTVQIRPHIGWILTLCGLAVNTVLWLRWNVLTLDGQLQDGSWFNSIFSLSAVALGSGAMLLRGDPSGNGRWKRGCQAILRILPLFIVSASAVGVVIASLMPDLRAYMRQAVLPGFGIAVVLAAIRQSLSLTERESLLRAEQGLRASEGRNRLIVETALDAVISINAEGRITDWNPVAERLFGYSRAEAQESTVGETIVPPEMRDAHRKGLADFLSTRQPKLLGTTFETDAVRKDGSIFRIEISVNVIESSEGPFFSAFIRDITKRIQDEETRQSLEAQLRHSQKMEAVGNLASGIAHDFNNVLAAIRGNADLAASDLQPGHPARESVDEIRRAGLRAAQLVQQIVAFSRQEKSTNFVRTNLAEIAYEVTRLMRSTLPPTIEVDVEAPRDLSDVMADPSQIHQVLVNLCTNASHAIGNRAGRIEIELTNLVSRDTQSGSVQIIVRDNGGGMPDEIAERIFEPFYTTKRLGEGTGLGLSVVHNIIASHGGEIRVNSKEGVGTEMRIELPVAEQSGPLAPDIRIPEQSKPITAKLAYIDDEDSLLLLIRRSLSRKGHKVTGFLSPVEAIAAILDDPGQFDIIITDLNMPEMSGIEVAKQLRSKLPNLPILLTSGYVSDEITAEAEAAGISRVVEKPSTLDELAAAIQAILQDLAAQRMLK